MWNKKPKANPMSATIKMPSPAIRVGLDGAKKTSKMVGLPKETLPKKVTMNTAAPKSSMIKRVGTKKNPTLTNEASMPKNKKMNVKLPRRKMS
jgi:hypothetical protein